MFQKISFIGNLGQDPNMRYLPDGTAVTNFSAACNRRWKDQASGEDKNETTWFRVSVWGRRAEVCNQYLERGRKVFVEGRLRPDPHTGGPALWQRQDGTMGSSYEVVAENVIFLSENGERHDHSSQTEHAPAAEEDDIPF